MSCYRWWRNCSMNKLFVIALLLFAPPAAALSIEPPLPDAAQEARAQALFSGLRCVVCQSESIADSKALVAADMRREIRSQIAARKSDADIVEYFVSRYGNGVLMRTPFNRTTWLLWLAPLFVLLGGGALAWRFFRKNK